MSQDTTFIVWSNGDPGVGIPGSYAEVTMYVDKNDKEYLQNVKDSLQKTFSELWDERTVFVMTDEEYKEWADKD